MKSILQELQNKKVQGQKSLAVLIDPDKITDLSAIHQLISLANESYVDYFFVGGSLITTDNLNQIVQLIKGESEIPVVLFPGNNMHISNDADAILFLSLISGRNADLLIGQHVNAAPFLNKSSLEILPTGYMLINSGSTSSASYMSNTMPIPPDKYSIASSTALAGQMLGLKLIYMDAGSGSKSAISTKMIRKVNETINCPLIIGGGITSTNLANEALMAGADVIVIGNAIEKNPNLMIEVSEKIYDLNKSLDVH
ncbi:MAG: geranylgeranylglyceryl/heptaprenylglyceryl phosphate synthase [Fulvivirga sp.]|jgi:phosphoglycerol geranylgeranyltransferase|uniref:geranylgeranylglyceryl/heptaprenylglyceryl phosphate synthase n=1 Tax=Fulvivirga sp. TaxID=1931237 RepID=UPI0032F6E1A4